MISAEAVTIAISVVKGAVLAGREINQHLTVNVLEENGIASVLPAKVMNPKEGHLVRWRGRQKELAGGLGDPDAQMADLDGVLRFSQPYNPNQREIIPMVRLYLATDTIGERWDSQDNFVEKGVVESESPPKTVKEQEKRLIWKASFGKAACQTYLIATRVSKFRKMRLMDLQNLPEQYVWVRSVPFGKNLSPSFFPFRQSTTTIPPSPCLSSPKRH